ncbi:DUF6415 family natural product biosynthesis protein [Streptomyces sp. RFCAC02]|uniref:DUF6415 family natural product biosynthesis protein n=1 Tax=Streptomyces sp. RFCAC02 TaxID=2499143 RepID=UPI00101E873E|nr:DUF6415 family natural product biosynthesis protein [Streptomyces sp. RFCAC02]
MTNLDHEAMRRDIRRARELYTAQRDDVALTAVTDRLRTHLRTLIPLFSALLPSDQGEAERVEAAVESAQYLLAVEPAPGVLARLVHMQLLSDAVSALSARLRTEGGAIAMRRSRELTACPDPVQERGPGSRGITGLEGSVGEDSGGAEGES